MFKLTNGLNHRAFTLVELLIVITILGILASIVVATFGNIQKNARDSKRRSEIDAIGKSLEAVRDATNTYTYDVNIRTFDFPATPTDPSGSSWGRYCIATGSAYTPPNDPVYNNWVVDGCDSGSGYSDFGSGSLNLNQVKAWKVCAQLEVGQVFCRSSIAR